MTLSDKTLELLKEYKEAIKRVEELHDSINEAIQKDTYGTLSLCGRNNLNDPLHIYAGYRDKGWPILESIADGEMQSSAIPDSLNTIHYFTINGVEALAVKVHGTEEE